MEYHVSCAWFLSDRLTRQYKESLRPSAASSKLHVGGKEGCRGEAANIEEAKGWLVRRLHVGVKRLEDRDCIRRVLAFLFKVLTCSYKLHSFSPFIHLFDAPSHSHPSGSAHMHDGLLTSVIIVQPHTRLQADVATWRDDRPRIEELTNDSARRFAPM
jgi:hypothetical protein